MTASARLYELADSWGDDVSFTQEQVQALASLVEAAEALPAQRQADLLVGNETPDMELGGLARLNAALTALQEHLEGDTDES